jgi:hypothetical protein
MKTRVCKGWGADNGRDEDEDLLGWSVGGLARRGGGCIGMGEGGVGHCAVGKRLRQ